MNKYHEILENLDKEAEEAGCKQYTVEIINEFYVTSVEDGDGAVSCSELGYAVWYLDNILEVFNPALEKDLSFLRKLRTTMEEWRKDLEFVDGALGIKIE